MFQRKRIGAKHLWNKKLPSSGGRQAAPLPARGRGAASLPPSLWLAGGQASVLRGTQAGARARREAPTLRPCLLGSSAGALPQPSSRTPPPSSLPPCQPPLRAVRGSSCRPPLLPCGMFHVKHSCSCNYSHL